MLLKVTVVIPIYQAERYIEDAVYSAISQPETAEIILIEDGSIDNSWPICQALAEDESKIKLLRHDGGVNKGAGASRNLGIRNARCDFIAFLDADDFYLPNRFSRAIEVFAADPRVEGIYEAIGVHFESDELKRDWQTSGRPHLTTMSVRVPPEALFEAQGPIGPHGITSLDGLVVRKRVFNKVGLFDEELRLHQDTAMFVKLAALTRLVPGRLDEPVAMRRVHSNNRITANRSSSEIYRNHLLMWSTLWKWGKENLSSHRKIILLERYVKYAIFPRNLEMTTTRLLMTLPNRVFPLLKNIL